MQNSSTTQGSNLGFLKCSISKGMFPDEYAVEFHTETDQAVSLFASKTDFASIDEDSSTGLLKVRVHVTKANPNIVSILLPSETLEQGSNVVSVNKQAIEKPV
jgi:hypothetical protein